MCRFIYIYKCNVYMALFQQTTSRLPPPVSFDPVFVDDAECAELNEKIIKKISDFYIFELS